jgi:eukaryotic-like serine/threonine-protein kinase
VASPEPIGIIAHYNLLERLEPAGPGELYRARDTRHGRTVLVRWLPPRFTGPLPSAAALLETARTLSAFSHPNAIAVFGAGEEAGRVYLAFEHVNGRPLRAEMGGRQMHVRRAVELTIQIADAVAEAHAAGYAHSGLSPEAVMVTAKGHAKVPAFGLASRTGFDGSDAAHLSDYGSPEEARGERADDRSDIYSVGAMLYEMLTLRRPPHRGAAAPSGANSRVPADLDRVILKAVAPNPELRYQSSASFAAELRAVLATLEYGDGDEADATPASRGIRTPVVVLVLVAIVAAVLWLVFRR